MNIKIENLAEEIAKAMQEYSKNFAEKVKDSVDKAALETDSEIRKHITFQKRTGKYIRAFSIKTVFENEHGKTKAWYVKSPHYRLTHLLEHGHAKRNGGRVMAYPHIKYGEEIALQNLPKYIEEAAKNG